MTYAAASEIIEQVVFSHAAEDGAEETAKEWNGKEYCMLQTRPNSPITKVQIEIATAIAGACTRWTFLPKK